MTSNKKYTLKYEHYKEIMLKPIWADDDTDPDIDNLIRISKVYLPIT